MRLIALARKKYDASDIWIRNMIQKDSALKLALCIDNKDYPASLELNKVYRVLPDADAASDGDIRVIDESGEDYLYPSRYFVSIDLHQPVKSLSSKEPNPLTRENSAGLVERRMNMAQIFVSHSQKDKDLIHFFLEAFAGTHVKPHLEELQDQAPTGVTAERIKGDIQASNVVFVLLSENVENLRHTRDWVNWECGTATNKEIWIFEPFESLGKIRVVVPRFNHYVLFERTQEWRKYLRSIIESYDDSHVVPTLAAATGGGALFREKDPGEGAAGGFMVGLVGLLLYNLSKPSYGIDVKCWKCFSNYKVHRYGNFRCAICNADSIVNQPEMLTCVNP